MKKNKTLMVVLGIFALVIVTTGASFAFFQYQRIGNTKVNVTSGDIQFSYMEDNQNASLANAFPVADSVGAIDITGEYEFTVNLTSSSTSTIANYNVSLVSDNNETKNYFTNDQIKFALVKNNVFVAGTSSTKGLKLSEISGFTSTLTNGEGVVLANQEIVSGTTDTYKLRIWISDDVSYNNTINNGVETGRYNGYSYSLKVKVTSSSNQITYEKGTDVIMNLASTQPGQIRVDNHEATIQTVPATEYRYFGANPNNYVIFNNELWRIIGVFDTDDGTGKLEKRLKIVRNELIGSYSWDSSDSTVIDGWGVNEWSQSDAKDLLNTVYYNQSSGTCYNGRANATTDCDFTSSGLSVESKTMLENAKWYLGAPAKEITTNELYISERSNAVGKLCSSGTFCNDTVTRTTSWVGMVGLLYPSDYGYAAGKACDNTKLSEFDSSCKDTDWINNGTNQWMLSPIPIGTYAYSIYAILSTSGIATARNASDGRGIRPTVYLKSSVKITSGTGTSSDPYQLSI